MGKTRNESQLCIFIRQLIAQLRLGSWHSLHKGLLKLSSNHQNYQKITG